MSQVEHRDCCRSHEERDLLLIGNEKLTASVGSSYDLYWTNQIKRHKYDSLVSILACSHYYRREDAIRCGYLSFACHDTLFCPRCCYRRLAWPLLDEYGSGFCAENEVWFVVVSLSSNPDETHRFIYRDMNGAELHHLKQNGLASPVEAKDYGIGFRTEKDLIRCRQAWQFFGDAIKSSTGNGRHHVFTGGFGGPELAVRFQPLRALPHANYILWSTGFSQVAAREIRERIRKQMRDCRRFKGLRIYPAIACYRLRASDDLQRVIKYICKPIDLARAYVNASELVNFAPDKLSVLNDDVNLFLDLLPILCRRLCRISRFGRCNSAHLQYLGEVSSYRKKQRERSAEQRRARPAIDAAIGSSTGRTENRKPSSFQRWENDLRKCGCSIAPPSSRFQYWNRANCRNSQPPPVRENNAVPPANEPPQILKPGLPVKTVSPYGT
jgi:hypothetical protein